MESKQNKSTKVKALIEAGKSVEDIAKEVGCNRALVYMVRKAHFPEMGRKYKTRSGRKLKRSKTKPIKFLATNIANVVAAATPSLSGPLRGLSGRTYAPVNTSPVASDMVNSPAHYTKGGIEVYDFIKAKALSYELGNVVKYVSRADHKGSKVEDLMKARWYLDAAIRVAGGAV